MVLLALPFTGDVPVERSDTVLVEISNDQGNVSDEEFDMRSIVDVRSLEDPSCDEQQDITDIVIGETSQNTSNEEQFADEDGEETQPKCIENTYWFCPKSEIPEGSSIHGSTFALMPLPFNLDTVGENKGSSIHGSPFTSPPLPSTFDTESESRVCEQKLKTKALVIQTKRFKIGVKQDRRGEPIFKVVEVGAEGEDNGLTLDKSLALTFTSLLKEFHDTVSRQFSGNNSFPGPPNPDDHLPKDNSVKGVFMVSDNKKYHIDLEANQRGRFLNVSQIVQEGDPTLRIAIPAQGLTEFCDALTDLLDDFGNDDDHAQGYGPASPPKKSDDDLNLTEERGYKPKVKPPEEKHTDATRLYKNVMCNVCSKEKSNIVFLPCGHLYSCDECATHVKMCKMCSTPVKKKQRVYRH